MINSNFLNMLTGLYEPRKEEAVKLILSKFEEGVAVDHNFYNNKAKVKACSDNLFEMINTTDKFLETLIKIESKSPYSIFTYILNENFSDIMFHENGYNLSDNLNEDKIVIPDEFLHIYEIFINHFINNIKFLSSKKFDTANAILDAEIGKLRFNLIHKTLNTNSYPIIVIRKQTIKSSIHMTDEYINSIGASEKQVELIQEFSLKGNVIIFGQVGSGKTTLLKYMGNYGLDKKRNLCTIEDTSELNIDVPIALLTNHHFKIKDLFTASLRQNPSHIIIGETRTEEIVDILESALTTNVMTTIHANSLERAIQRIIFMSRKHTGNISSQDMQDLINASVDCFIFMEDRKISKMWIKKGEHHDNIYDAYVEVV